GKLQRYDAPIPYGRYATPRFPWVLVAMRPQKTQGQLISALPQPLKPFAIIKNSGHICIW
ncbi:MAG: hypothetical protein KAG34_11450, partial [Cocleimonas sp.]|nr:hypothetical protein [Cocleimonas sp.]